MTRLPSAAIAIGVFAALGALLSLAGCGHVKTPVFAFTDDGAFLPLESGDGLVSDPNSKIADVPMPIGFKPVPSQCRFTAVNDVRVVHHVYQGHAKEGDALQFYRFALPSNDWSLVDIQSVGNTAVMRYTKGPEQLTVTIQRGWSVVTLTVEIKSR